MQNSQRPIYAILNKLERVIPRSTGKFPKWIALCPAHEDKNRSLSVAEADDGRVLLHCFAGCPPADILAAMGMQLSDLFVPLPETQGDDKLAIPKTFVNWKEKIATLKEDLSAISIGAALTAMVLESLLEDYGVDNVVDFTLADAERLSTAAARLRDLLDG